MIAPELDRYRSRYPGSRRLAILEAMAAAAQPEDGQAMAHSGMDYLRLTRTIPPGCYAVCESRKPSYFLAGEVVKRRRGEVWVIYLYSPQVWR